MTTKQIFTEDAISYPGPMSEVSVQASEDAVRLSVNFDGLDQWARVHPATADAIASALHVAAAQVRSARGEAVGWQHVENDVMGVGDMVCINGPTVAESPTDFVLIHKADVPRLIAELGAWLAAHPEVAK